MGTNEALLAWQTAGAHKEKAKAIRKRVKKSITTVILRDDTTQFNGKHICASKKKCNAFGTVNFVPSL
jgi:hypothetical protein